jgi:hypothetical protein
MKWSSAVRSWSFEPPVGHSARILNSIESPSAIIQQGFMLAVLVTRLPVRTSCHTQLVPQVELPLLERSAVHT